VTNKTWLHQKAALSEMKAASSYQNNGCDMARGGVA